MVDNNRKLSTKLLSILITTCFTSLFQNNYGALSADSCIAGDDVCINTTGGSVVNTSVQSPQNITTHPDDEFNYLSVCPSNMDCSQLSGDCITCNISGQCVYGSNVSDIWCQPRPRIVCTGTPNFTKTVQCKYGYQLSPWQYTCDMSKATKCKVVSAPRQRYEALCTVRETVLCLGRRRFYKRFPCNWTSGYRWSTALLLSITLGGLGVDRFYLGLWQEGLGKLFSFGGLGVWTIVDVVLIARGYVGPSDGSVYIY